MNKVLKASWNGCEYRASNDLGVEGAADTLFDPLNSRSAYGSLGFNYVIS